jgi:hypothetical protein
MQRIPHYIERASPDQELLPGARLLVVGAFAKKTKRSIEQKDPKDLRDALDRTHPVKIYVTIEPRCPAYPTGGESFALSARVMAAGVPLSPRAL